MEFIRLPYTQLRQTFENQVAGWTPLNPGGVVHNLSVQAWFDAINRHSPDPTNRDIRGTELIHSYWLEEGMLIQSVEAIALRFQNQAPGGSHALATLDISPLRPISDWLWAYVDDQHRRLGLKRRAYEYAHQYGLRMVGKAIGSVRPADNRSAFLSCFHTLLNTCMRFYRELDDQQVQQDARPVLNALRELQMILLQGASNQFGTIPTQARVESLLMQHLLASDEVIRFLAVPRMISYPQTWMGSVDVLRRLMRWGDVSIIEFWRLATFGELLLCSVRWGHFGPASTSTADAEDWAMAFRDLLTDYVHSYRAVTGGVDLSQELISGQAVDATMPSVYLSQREADYRRRKAG